MPTHVVLSAEKDDIAENVGSSVPAVSLLAGPLAAAGTSAVGAVAGVAAFGAIYVAQTFAQVAGPPLAPGTCC